MRSALIGSWMGIKPGGATPASFMSYGIARKFSKTPEKFGTGVLSALVNLGYQRAAAEKVLASVSKSGQFDAMFREALAALSK